MPKTGGIYIGGGCKKAKAFGKRRSKASPLSAEEWADVPLAVRESTFWCVWRMGTLLPRSRGADGAVREGNRFLDGGITKSGPDRRASIRGPPIAVHPMPEPRLVEESVPLRFWKLSALGGGRRRAREQDSR